MSRIRLLFKAVQVSISLYLIYILYKYYDLTCKRILDIAHQTMPGRRVLVLCTFYPFNRNFMFNFGLLFYINKMKLPLKPYLHSSGKVASHYFFRRWFKNKRQKIFLKKRWKEYWNPCQLPAFQNVRMKARSKFCLKGFHFFKCRWRQCSFRGASCNCWNVYNFLYKCF